MTETLEEQVARPVIDRRPFILMRQASGENAFATYKRDADWHGSGAAEAYRVERVRGMLK